MKRTIKPLLLFVATIAFALAANAQVDSNPFKPLKKQNLKSNPFRPLGKPGSEAYFVIDTTTNDLYTADPIVAGVKDMTAWRFTPMVGYNLKTKQLQAGIGYGIQWLHFDNNTEKYYADFSVKAVGWVNGTTTPSLNPPNITSFGITFGVLNELIQFGGAYTPATSDTKGSFGPIVNFAIPLNN